MKFRLLADENTSHNLISACCKLASKFPLVHISDWKDGAWLGAKDSALLMHLREECMVLVSFDRASLPMHAGRLTREGLGHSGIILFRRFIPAVAYGNQAKELVNFWEQGRDWEWDDRIEYLPRP